MKKLHYSGLFFVLILLLTMATFSVQAKITGASAVRQHVERQDEVRFESADRAILANDTALKKIEDSNISQVDPAQRLHSKPVVMGTTDVKQMDTDTTWTAILVEEKTSGIVAYTTAVKDTDQVKKISVEESTPPHLNTSRAVAGIVQQGLEAGTPFHRMKMARGLVLVQKIYGVFQESEKADKQRQDLMAYNGEIEEARLQGVLL